MTKAALKYKATIEEPNIRLSVWRETGDLFQSSGQVLTKADTQVKMKGAFICKITNMNLTKYRTHYYKSNTSTFKNNTGCVMLKWHKIIAFTKNEISSKCQYLKKTNNKRSYPSF